MTATSTDRSSDEQVERVRRLCRALPETNERLSHGEPTFFVGKRVFVMFADNHPGDGRVAVWLPAPCWTSTWRWVGAALPIAPST